MTEGERKGIVEKIQNDILEVESLNGKYYEKLNELSSNPIVVEYLQLLENINRIESSLESYRSPIDGLIRDSLEERIKRGFRWAQCSCNHNIWIYGGSYYRWRNFKGEEEYVKDYSEDLGDCRHTFSYNTYVCLECRKSVKISDWREFENSHLVLKNQGHFVDIEYYQDLYYQLLYHNYGFSIAEQTVIVEFNNREKGNNKSLSKKKSLTNV